jgi:Uma2 family endonuclease
MSTLREPDAEIKLDDLPPAPNGPMTEEEFLAWCPEGVRAEWVDGRVVIMSPESTRHNFLGRFLIFAMTGFTRKHSLGEILCLTAAVRLGAQRRVRGPDIIFVAKERLHLIQSGCFEGAPDLAVEIVSPSSESRDWREKYQDYEAAGVREYWIIDPRNEHMGVYGLSSEGTFQLIHEREGRVDSEVLPGFFLKSAWLWQDPLPSELDILRELGVWS